MRRLLWLVAAYLAGFMLVSCAERSSAALPRGRGAVYAASLLVWCGSSHRECYEGVHAYHVAGCETGGTYDRWAKNGQYEGYWQMGSYEQGQCGEVWGRDPWSQARAAHCWWHKTGDDWGAWACG